MYIQSNFMSIGCKLPKLADRLNRLVRPIWTAALILCGVALAAYAMEITFGLWFAQPVREALIASNSTILIKPDHKLTPEELSHLSSLVQQGAVLTQDQLLGHLNTFYQGLIQILVTILGLVGIVAYFFIRSVSLDQAKTAASKTAEEIVQRKFEEKKFSDEIESKVEAIMGATPFEISDLTAAIEELKPYDLSDRISQIERDILALSAAVAIHDREEEDSENGTLVADTQVQD